MDEDRQDGQNLGSVTAWQIKDFPTSLRQRIIAAAKEADQTVAEYVTAAMLRHLEHQTGSPEPAKNRFANRANPVNRSETRFRTVIEMACALTEHQENMPKGIARLATRLIKSELESMLPASRPQFSVPRALASPPPSPDRDDETQATPQSPRLRLS